MPDMRVPSLGADGKIRAKHLPNGLGGADATRLKPRGEYTANTAYAVNDLVHNGPLTFYALQTHTSSGPAPTVTTAFWKQVGGSSTFTATGVQQLRQVSGTYQKRADYGIPATTPVFWRGKTFPPEFIEDIDMWYQE